MIDKIAATVEDALAGTPDGATVMVGGFGTAGIPGELIDGLIAQGARELTIVNNNAGNGDHGLAALLKAGRVRKIICSFPRQADSHVFDALYRSGKIELELVPQAMAYYDRLERESTKIFSASPYKKGATPVPLHFDFSYNYYDDEYYRPGAEVDIYRLDNCKQQFGRVPPAPVGTKGLEKGIGSSAGTAGE